MLSGARQIGKTWALETFGKEYFEYCAHFDFDRQAELKTVFQATKEPGRIIKELSLYCDAPIVAGKTLIIFDEVQECEEALNSLKYFCEDAPQYHVIAAGSLLGVAVKRKRMTVPVGKVQVMRMYPLTFKEFYDVVGGDRAEAWNSYYTYGGLPQVTQISSAQQKEEYLINLFELTYLSDIIERNHIRNTDGLKQLVQILASAIGSPTNPKRISNTFKSTQGLAISDKTLKEYIGYMQDAFLIEEALRYDVKGRKYIGTETKYYFSDLGLRAAALNFRQQEEPHIMENIIYNELRQRGYRVDVGLVETWRRNENNKLQRNNLEVDFVVNRGAERVYIQSAFRMPTPEKENQEHQSLLNINDSFLKIIIVGDNIMRKVNDYGIVTMGLLDFLLDSNSISSLLGKK